MVDAKVQDHILKLLNPDNPWAYQLVEELAGYETTVPAVLELNLLKQLAVRAR
jgi:hypothetical protein